MLHSFFFSRTNKKKKKRVYIKFVKLKNFEVSRTKSLVFYRKKKCKV
jgi:hypothetical protein